MRKSISLGENNAAFKRLFKDAAIVTFTTLPLCAIANEAPDAQDLAGKVEARKTVLLCVGEKHYTDKLAQRILGQFSREPVEVSLAEDMKSAVVFGFTPRFRTAGKGFLESSIASLEPYAISATDTKIYHASSSTKKIGAVTELSSFNFSIDRRTGEMTIVDEIYSVNTETWDRSESDKVYGSYNCSKKPENIF